ncbi:unnamed protein product [Durusdinium trenchii]|uniref:Uncharacterized protein n=2 Tax=Durusdinium trenchii TaxID=1381693 RepID=A0ABP0M1C2_9DINO
MAYDSLATARELTWSEDSVSESVWQELEQKELLGPKTRRWYQHVLFGYVGWLWALATLCVCIYAFVHPHVGIAALLGPKGARAAPAMAFLATVCAISGTSAAASLLQSEVFGELLERYQRGGVPQDWQAHRFDCQCESMMHLAKKLLGYGILLGIPLSPAFSSDAIYLLAWLLLVVLIAFYFPGYHDILTVVVKLCRNLVEQIMKEIRDGPELWTGKGQFWQEMTEKHQRMDGILEDTWALAAWVVLPRLAALLIFGLTGLVACLSAVVTSQNGLIAFAGLLLICVIVLSIAERLMEMASITQMCMTPKSKTPGIRSYAIAKSGPSPCSESGLKNAGYSNFGEERADHARFLTYLTINRTGVEMFGVLIDAQLIARYLFQATTMFLALFSYMLANLDIKQKDLMGHVYKTGCYFSQMFHFKGENC